MGKVKRKFVSLKWCFAVYLSVCFFIAFAGSMCIGLGTNYVQDYYETLHSDVRLVQTYDERMEVLFDDKQFIDRYVVTDKRPFADRKYMIRYSLIVYAQFLLIPLYIMSCVAVTGIIFYKRELQKPIEILLDSSQKISENQLDFRIEYPKQNELGKLCTAFDNMRHVLDENNRNMWRSLEERKRLNSAFSHDLRTPLTILKGYNEFLTKYGENVSPEKLSEILFKMNGQINRLESYTYKMSAVQKLEDIVPAPVEVKTDTLRENLSESGKYICKDKKFSFSFRSDTDILFIDCQLVMEVYENIISNAERYADNKIYTDVFVSAGVLRITVTDDGKGFTKKALKLAKEPFYRDDREQNTVHFGLGLYICKIICEKCGGTINISNTGNGGKVTAEIFFENQIKS
ncbi:MAG: HAMP domain-containing histidine kinase [Ruminococcus sp.]|nr:HAMP domain-containing histidine kinase [Ruminococcus sp.]